MLHPKARMLGLLILLIAGVWVAIGQAGGVNAAAPAQSNNSNGVQRPATPQPPTPGQVASYAPGIPAIHPHLAVPAGSSAATFTTDDVRQYVLSHPVWMATTTGPVTVAQITFMTSGALSVQLNGESIGRPDTALVCYAELHGVFSFPGPATNTTAHTAYEVFDAQTGNLIMVGGRP
jgi:hypothetical protein